MQKYKLFGLAPPIWVAQYIYSIDIQRIIKCESKRCQSQEETSVEPYLLCRCATANTPTNRMWPFLFH